MLEPLRGRPAECCCQHICGHGSGNSRAEAHWSGDAEGADITGALKDSFKLLLIYSLQFESGSLSEASIGNVGMNPETTGWVDYVVTPMAAYGLIVAVWIEERVRNPALKLTVRLALNPGRTLSNASTGRAPWHRAGRSLSWR